MAEEDGGIVGYALGGGGSRRGWILGVAVEPASQRSGIGRAVTTRLIETVAASGMNEIATTVHPGNSPSLGLFESLGFEREGEEEDYYGEGMPRVGLRLCLGS